MPALIFNVYCATCGAGLCNQTSVNGPDISVEVCQACLTKAKDEGYDEGYEDALKDNAW